MKQDEQQFPFRAFQDTVASTATLVLAFRTSGLVAPIQIGCFRPFKRWQKVVECHKVHPCKTSKYHWLVPEHLKYNHIYLPIWKSADYKKSSG